MLGSIAFMAYIYITAEVPGGEKRYEQVFRQFKDSHPGIVPGV